MERKNKGDNLEEISMGYMTMAFSIIESAYDNNEVRLKKLTNDAEDLFELGMNTIDDINPKGIDLKDRISKVFYEGIAEKNWSLTSKALILLSTRIQALVVEKKIANGIEF